MKRFAALLLALIMVLSMAAGVAAAEEPRHLTYALWWDLYYDSDDAGWEDSPSATGKDSEIMRFDNVKNIENTYGVTYEFVNATWEGIKDSINNSILAGEPDFDMYMVDLMAFGVPAVMNGLATDLRTVLDADDPFLAHEDPILDYIELPNGAVSLIFPKGAEDAVSSTNPLAFNLQMIEEANLEDPRDLYERGEWTWDKFLEYCRVLTRDNDGDGVTDVYGYGAWIGDALPAWYMSNGTYMAATPEENLTSPEIGETLSFLQNLYLTEQVAYPIPEENGWDVCRFLYRDKKVAFTTTAVWIMANYDDYNWDGLAESTLDFDMVFVPYPIGPSGNQDTNTTKIASGNYWMLPAGVEDPKLVFDVFRAYQNWYQDDIELRDDPEELEWWYTATSDKLDIQNWNFSVLELLGSKVLVDFYQVFGDDLPMLNFLNGEYTPAQFQETYRQTVQDALDQIFG